MDLTQKEEFRRLVLAWLAQRCAVAYNSESVQRGVSREMPCTRPEVDEALHFLFTMKLLNEIPNSMGSVRYFQANAAGILAYERGD
jgi:hypothetical protein